MAFDERVSPVYRSGSGDDAGSRLFERYGAEDKIKFSYHSALAERVTSDFVRAKRHRDDTGVSEQLLSDQLQYEGRYEAERLSKIHERGGCDTFFNITATKVNTAEAWFEDILNPSRGLPVYIRPTPVPTLSDRDRMEIMRRFERKAVEGGLMERLMRGGNVDEAEVVTMVDDLQQELDREQRSVAHERADALQAKCRDSLHEGGFVGAFKDFLHALSVYPTAILKGPIIRPMERLRFDPDEGEHVSETIYLPTFESVSPHHYYPEPNAEHSDDGFVCEVVSVDKTKLAMLRGEEGWNEVAINRLLEEGDDSWKNVSSELEDTYEHQASDIEDRDLSYNGGNVSTSLDGIEYWGKIQGRDLKEFGVKGVADDNAYYCVCALIIGMDVVYVAQAPKFYMGANPYHATSYKKSFRSAWGTSIPQAMRWCQENYNAAIRNAVNNAAYSANVYKTVDLDAIDPREADRIHEDYPGKTFQYRSSKMRALGGSSRPVEFFQPDLNIKELIELGEYFAEMSDDATQIPRFVHGNANIGGAGETASGMEMLMSSASKGIRLTLFNVDQDVLGPMTRMLAQYLMSQDTDLRGDYDIVPHGALESLIREEQVMRAMNFLDRVNNPVDGQIVKLEHRRNLWEDTIKQMGLSPDRSIVTAEELRRAQQEAMQQAQQAPPGAEPQPQPMAVGGAA